MRTYRNFRVVALALALSACATTPGPVEVRTVEVVRPLPVPCVDPAAVPKPPAKARLTGDARTDASTLAALDLRLRAELGKALALLGGCVTGD